MNGVIVLFAAMLGVSLMYGAMTSFGIERERSTPAQARGALRAMLAVELVDTILVGVGLLVVARPRRQPRLEAAPAPAVWALSVVAIVLAVGVNHAYHAALLRYVGVQPVRDAVQAATGITPLLLLAYCVQPAVVEELFFRYLALDTLRGVMGVHQAVAISSLMFGLAHIGVPLSIPMLALVGVPLGYARVASDRLSLPMLLHFLHNFVIVLSE
jgi:membrane protease YdiL (CAAX protease family)